MKIIIATNEPSSYMDLWFNDIEKEFDLEVIYHKKINKLHPWMDFQGYQGDYFSSLSIRDIFKKVKKSDFILVCGWLKFYFFITLIICFLLKKRVAIYTDHPFHTNYYADLFKRFFLYKKVNYIFCATMPTCNYIENKYGHGAKEKTVYFPYGIDTNVQLATNTKKHDGINVFVASNFYQRKGYAVLFEALALLEKSDKSNDYHFTIAGIGEEFNLYKEKASKLNLDINMLGWIEKDRYNEIMRNTDIYIHPSIEEPFGIPPVDAMCMGKVVIVCDGVMSLNGIIRQGVNGFHYPSPVNCNDAAFKLHEILYNLDKQTFSRIGKAAHSDVVEHFSVINSVYRLKACING